MRKATARPTGKARRRPAARRKAVAAVAVSAAELRALKGEIERRMKAPGAARSPERQRAGRKGGAPLRWNPEPEDVQKSVVQLVLTIVELLRRLMERQAIRRMEQKTLTRKEVEVVGEALMKLEETVREIGKKFGLTPEELNLDLGPLGKLM